MRVARDGDGAVDDGGDEGPDEARHELGVVRDGLQREGDGVDVGTVVADDGEGEDHDTERAEVAESRHEDLVEQAADVVFGIGVRVGRVVDRRGADRGAEHHAEAEWEEEPDEGIGKYLDPADVDGLVTAVVGGVGAPARGETEDRRREGQNRSGLAGPGAHG